jgi:hypothetical protein
MPIEPKFWELDFRRIERGSRRMAKKLTVRIGAPIDKVTTVIERREVNIDIVLNEYR